MIGRPLIFKSPEELEKAIEGYFNVPVTIEANSIFGNEEFNTGEFTERKNPTLAGLAYHLGIDRQTLYNYKERDQFFDIIKKATDRVEATYEERLIYSGQPTGVIFALKNMGWKDKTETGFTDKDGNDVKPIQIIKLPDNGRSDSTNEVQG